MTFQKRPNTKLYFELLASLQSITSKASLLEEQIGPISKQVLGSEENGIKTFQNWFQAFRLVQVEHTLEKRLLRQEL